MDDELGFASVWSSDPKPTLLPSTANLEFPSFEDSPFETHGSESTTVNAEPDDFGDDFGDFGDFGDAQNNVGFDDNEMGGFEEASSDEGGFYDAPPPDPGPSNWEPLRLRPMPSMAELADQIEDLLYPMYGHIDPESVMSQEGIRQVEGVGQFLVTPESRSLYESLMNSSPPSTQPPDWTRSRIRRQHLVSLGIPINLDEVLPQSHAAKALPALQVTTRPMSAPPGPRPERLSHHAQGSQSRARTPQGSPGGGQRIPQVSASSSLSIGPKPVLERERVEQALALDLDTLPLLPLSTLKAHLESLQSLTTSTSNLLSHLLQTRDALQQDSETYNGLIAELVGEAQKMKAGPRAKVVKRGSAFS